MDDLVLMELQVVIIDSPVADSLPGAMGGLSSVLYL